MGVGCPTFYFNQGLQDYRIFEALPYAGLVFGRIILVCATTEFDRHNELHDYKHIINIVSQILF